MPGQLARRAIGRNRIAREQGVHTASDIPLSAAGRGAAAFTGVQDNTEVFFKAMQAVLGGSK